MTETTIFKGSPSLVLRLVPLSAASIVAAAAVLGMLVYGAAEPAVLWALGAAALAALVYAAVQVIEVTSTDYEVTTQRIRVRRGILTKRTEEVELYRATDTTLIEPLVSRLFGLGTIHVRTMEDERGGAVLLEAVHGADRLREQLRAAIEECRDRKRARVIEFDDPQAM